MRAREPTILLMLLLLLLLLLVVVLMVVLEVLPLLGYDWKSRRRLVRCVQLLRQLLGHLAHHVRRGRCEVWFFKGRVGGSAAIDAIFAASGVEGGVGAQPGASARSGAGSSVARSEPPLRLAPRRACSELLRPMLRPAACCALPMQTRGDVAHCVPGCGDKDGVGIATDDEGISVNDTILT